MIGIRPQTPLIVRRPPPTTLPLRARHEISKICAPFCTCHLPVLPGQPVIPSQPAPMLTAHASEVTERHRRG